MITVALSSAERVKLVRGALVVDRLTAGDARELAFAILAAAAQLDGQQPKLELGVAGDAGTVVEPVSMTTAVSFSHRRRVWREPWQEIA